MARSNNIAICDIECVPCGNGRVFAFKKAKMNGLVVLPSVSVPFLFFVGKSNAGEPASVVFGDGPVSTVDFLAHIAKVLNAVITLVSVYVVNKIRLSAVVNNPCASMSKINFAENFGVKVSHAILRGESLLSAKLSSPFCVRFFLLIFAAVKNAFWPWLECEQSAGRVIIKQNSKQFWVVESVRHALRSLALIKDTLTVTNCFVGVKANA